MIDRRILDIEAESADSCVAALDCDIFASTPVTPSDLLRDVPECAAWFAPKEAP